MKTHYTVIAAIATSLLASQSVLADTPSAFGSGFDVQDFYKPFTLEEITPQNQQTWPYYKYASAHWDDYAVHGTAKINRSTKPARLTVAEGDERLDMNMEWKDGQTFIESLEATSRKVNTST